MLRPVGSHISTKAKSIDPWHQDDYGSGFQGGFPLSELETILQSEPDASRAAEWSHYYTSESHFTGEGITQSIWTKKKWEEFGIPETGVYSDSATISAPVVQRLTMIDKSESLFTPVIMYEAKLMEELPPDDPSTIRIPAFHANSVSGNVTAQFVYANFGLGQDYDDLERSDVEVRGKIAIVKHGRIQRHQKMTTAARRGLIAIVMYTDPQQDGNITEQNGYKTYPHGPARPETYIERGAVNSPAGLNDTTGKFIPSLPVSYGDIVPLLKALNGHGTKAADLGSEWLGGGLYFRGVEYYSGPSPSHVVLNFNNQMTWSTKDMYSVFGIIRGSIDDEVIILGSHRDSWGTGAGDSSSASAALMEVVRSFATAYKAGWRPRRTIIFASWEGFEVSPAGSKDWVKAHLPWLRKSAVAYLNVVVAAGGTEFQAKTTPLLQSIIHKATKAVASPQGGTVFDQWGGELAGVGGGDAINFGPVCMSTSDLSFGAQYWPYHSNFDTFTWMNNTGDPGWKYHVTMAKLWSLMAAYLSESAVLQMKTVDLAVAIRRYLERLKESISGAASFNFQPLEDAIADFHNASIDFDAYASSIGPTEKAETVERINQKYIQLERQFCYEDEHLIYAHGSFYQNPSEFPHLSESLMSGNLEEAQKWMAIIQTRIRDAARFLKSA